MDNQKPLKLSREEMRSMGYRVVDMLVEHLDKLPDKPLTRRSDRASLEARLRTPPPLHGRDGLCVLGELERDVLNTMVHADHPRYFAFLPGPGNHMCLHWRTR
jgi:aromatic-L-amino-acid decarboxylase